MFTIVAFELFMCFILMYQAPIVEPPAAKVPKKPTAKSGEQKEKKGKATEVAKEEPLDPVEEKLRQQR